MCFFPLWYEACSLSQFVFTKNNVCVVVGPYYHCSTFSSLKKRALKLGEDWSKSQPVNSDIRQILANLDNVGTKKKTLKLKSVINADFNSLIR